MSIDYLSVSFLHCIEIWYANEWPLSLKQHKKVVNTMIPISAMVQLFDLLVSVLFLLESLHVNQLFVCLIPTLHQDMVCK